MSYAAGRAAGPQIGAGPIHSLRSPRVPQRRLRSSSVVCFRALGPLPTSPWSHSANGVHIAPDATARTLVSKFRRAQLDTTRGCCVAARGFASGPGCSLMSSLHARWKILRSSKIEVRLSPCHLNASVERSNAPRGLRNFHVDLPNGSVENILMWHHT